MTLVDPSKKWSHPLPVWASRPDGDGLIASFTLPLWLFMVLAIVATINALGWGIVGLVELAEYVF